MVDLVVVCAKLQKHCILNLFGCTFRIEGRTDITNITYLVACCTSLATGLKFIKAVVKEEDGDSYILGMPNYCNSLALAAHVQLWTPFACSILWMPSIVVATCWCISCKIFCHPLFTSSQFAVCTQFTAP